MKNKISIAGTIVAPPVCTHTIKNKTFYRAEMLSVRLSGNVDRLPVVFEEKHLHQLSVGSIVMIDGCIRTRNIVTDGKTHLDVFIYARGVTELDRPDDLNDVEIDGVVCYASAVREVGARKISCIKIANNGLYNKANYLPCVLWGHDADRQFEIGDEIRIRGRLQSRDFADSEGNKHRTYEISVCGLY